MARRPALRERQVGGARGGQADAPSGLRIRRRVHFSAPARDRRYAHLSPRELPSTESLKDTVARVVPCWEDSIAPRVRSGERVLVAAHGNSLRALVKHLDRIS